MSGPIVYVVDDDDAVRRSAAFMLKTAGYAVQTFENGVDFLKAAPGLDPGCVLLDVRMPIMDGLAVQRALRDAGVTMPVVVLTGHGDVGIAVTAMKAGALDFIEKPFEAVALLNTIEEAHRQIAEKGDDVIRAGEARVRLNVLTPRERDVLEGLVRGQANKVIAYDLGISARTVEIHRANVMTKLGVSSLSAALRIAFAAGLGEGPAAAG